MKLYALCKDCGHQWLVNKSLVTCPKCGGNKFIVNTAPQVGGGGLNRETIHHPQTDSLRPSDERGTGLAESGRFFLQKYCIKVEMIK